MADFFFPEFLFPDQRSSGLIPIPDVLPGFMVTPHVHPNTDEIVRVISGSGEAHVIFEDPSSLQIEFASTRHFIQKIRAGDTIFIARGNYHYFLNPLLQKDRQGNILAVGNLVLQTSFANEGFDTLTIKNLVDETPKLVFDAAQTSSSIVIQYQEDMNAVGGKV